MDKKERRWIKVEGRENLVPPQKKTIRKVELKQDPSCGSFFLSSKGFFEVNQAKLTLSFAYDPKSAQNPLFTNNKNPLIYGNTTYFDLLR